MDKRPIKVFKKGEVPPTGPSFEELLNRKDPKKEQMRNTEASVKSFVSDYQAKKAAAFKSKEEVLKFFEKGDKPSEASPEASSMARR